MKSLQRQKAIIILHELFGLGLLCLLWASSAYSACPEEARIKLELARNDLRVGEATEARIAAELDELKGSENTSPDVLEDYETYLAQVQAMVEENRKIVQEMEAACASLPLSTEASSRPASRGEADLRDLDPPEADEFNRLGALDREFNESLAAFDEMLLEEMDEIRLRSSQKMRDLAEEAAAAVQRLREQGADVNTSSDLGTFDSQADEMEQEGGGPHVEEEGEGSESYDAEEEGLQPEDESQGQKAMENQGDHPEGGLPGDSVTQRDGLGEGGEILEGEDGGEPPGPHAAKGWQGGAKGDSKGAGPDQIRRGRTISFDEDIVARQIREAAERETDPELKEKLWREYEAYTGVSHH